MAWFFQVVERWCYSLLLVLLVATIVLQPLFLNWPFVQALLILAYGAILTGGVYASGARRREVLACSVLAGLVVGLKWAAIIYEVHELSFSLVVVTVLFAAFTMWRTIWTLAMSPAKGSDALAGAVFGYFLLVVVWALFFQALEIWEPGSFTLDLANDRFTELLYFSLVTITTLGYGDIAPVAPFARIGAGLEAALGALYLAIMIARIVGALGTRRD